MKAIYSVITGDYDMLPVAPYFEGWDCIMFTDYPVKDENNGWEIRQLPKSDNPELQSRYYKIMSHIELSEYDKVCYIDGNQTFLRQPPNNPTWFLHPGRNDIFNEAKQIVRLNKAPKTAIEKQLAYYKSKGYKDSGLYMNGFFVREHKPDINKLHEVWYKETSRFTSRDQLSLPFAIWITGIAPENILHSKEKDKYAIITNGHKQNYYANN